jgi:hypothetical protein
VLLFWYAYPTLIVQETALLCQTLLLTVFLADLLNPAAATLRGLQKLVSYTVYCTIQYRQQSQRFEFSCEYSVAGLHHFLQLWLRAHCTIKTKSGSEELYGLRLTVILGLYLRENAQYNFKEIFLWLSKVCEYLSPSRPNFVA